jgi:non-canonical (house-cleaning) NTP pyrophosphatase
MPRTRGITSGHVIIIVQSKILWRCRDCLQNDSYHGVTLEAGMFLMTYYLSLLQVHQAHAEQDALNEGHHQWRCHHHHAKQILWRLRDCLQNDSYHGVTLEAGMFLMTYYLSLLQVHQAHAKQDPPNKGHHQW